jgi:hypothetical protein
MDININVRAVDSGRRSNTSADKQAANKKTNSPMAKRAGAKKTAGAQLNLKAAAKTVLPIVAISQAKQKTFAYLNRANRIAGTISGNRFGESRRRDTLNAVSNPIRFARDSIVTAFNGFYETQRKNEKIDYTRQLAGMSFPFREGNNGITI